MMIYPSNIDSTLAKREGRKVSKKHGVDSPKAEEILSALDAIGEEGAKLDEGVAYPRRNWEAEGRVVLEKKSGKSVLMRRVSKEIKRLRSSS
jgi:signal recognition particle subunit SRP19